MQPLAEPVSNLIDAFCQLPGVGPKTATRLTYFLLRSDPNIALTLAHALAELKARTVFCGVCHNIADQDPCAICANSQRDHGLICVVEEPLDVQAIERTGEYKGVYHVLHGAISPVEGVGPEQLKIGELLARLREGPAPESDVPAVPGREVLLATNPNLEGEATAMYIARLLKPLGIRVTRLARGLPMGGDLEYADEVTLGRALAAFVTALHRNFEDAVENLILYGSAARGERRANSDVDVFVVLTHPLAKSDQEAIHALARELSATFRCELNPLVMSPDRMAWHRQGSSLWLNVQRDGIGLWHVEPDVTATAGPKTLREGGRTGLLTPAQEEELRIYMEYAAEDLAAAQALIDGHMARQSISRCYYAAFYAASALLLSKGITRPKHSAVRAALHQEFVRTGILPATLGAVFDELQRERRSADYDMRFLPDEEVAEERMTQTGDFVAAARVYLTEKGFLS